METRQDRKQKGQFVVGSIIHASLNEVLRKRKNAGNRYTKEEQQLLEFVEDIEEKFQLKIVLSEKHIGGFSTELKGQERPYYWSGKIDAIGLMNGNDKDGCGVVVLDWITCSNIKTFWENATQYKNKLHQCLIYRRLLAVHMREYFEDPSIPEPGIMIVALDKENINDNDPRLCMDFNELEEAGIFEGLNRFKWDANLYSQNKSIQGHNKEIPMVRSLLLVRSIN